MNAAVRFIVFCAIIPCLQVRSCCYGPSRKAPAKSAGVSGQLLCRGVPSSGVKVKLYDVDLLLDDKMASGVTDSMGRFLLEGYLNEFETVVPELNIYHDCNDDWPCQRQVMIRIPTDYVNFGERAAHYYDVGVLELSGKFPHESRSCLN
ncbi:CRE-TTR-8 protein [Aphelenchoides avenae]|nr:CRE-TTR-8 protein [Aphelenchus avenae]